MSDSDEWPSLIPADLDRIAELRRRQLAAEADPLERGTVLEWQGPTLHPEADARISVLDPATSRQHRRSPALPLISSEDSPVASPTHWTLRLVEPIQEGAGQTSQVWRARASRLDADVGVEVVVKLFDFLPNLDPDLLPFLTRVPSQDVQKKECSEARAYELLRDFQGSVVPFCYGFYHFRLPRGDDVVGVILEDLTEIAITLPAFVKRELARGTLSQDKVDDSIYANFALFRLLLERNISLCPLVEEVFLTRTEDSTIRLIWTGLSGLHPPAELGAPRMHLKTSPSSELTAEEEPAIWGTGGWSVV